MGDIMKEKKNIPEIRFKGFEGEWEKSKIGELGDVVTGSTPSTQEPLYYSNYGIPWVTPTDITENITHNTAKHLSVKGMLVSRIVPKNTILVTCIASIGKNTMLGTLGSFNQQINGLIPDENKYNAYFLYTESALWSNEMKRSASSGTMQIVNKTEFSELKTFIPSIEEQSQIGSYFQNLDKQITLEQQKHDKLVTLKKAMLEKMFPKEGASVPEIRFEGFEGEWIQKEIKELFKITRGEVLAATETSQVKTGFMTYPVYSSQTKNNGLMGYYHDYLFENAITWTTDGANAGTVKYRKGKFYSTNVNGVLLSDDGYANQAIAESINIIAWKHVSYVGNPKLMNNVMSKIKIYISDSLEEQQLISDYFNTFDTFISLQQQKIDKLKNIKKACLEKMFV
jgi:type I restriction enzyme S subunit